MDKQLFNKNKAFFVCIILVLFIGCHERKNNLEPTNTKKMMNLTRRLPDRLFIIPTKMNGFSPRYRSSRIELTISSGNETHHYLEEYNDKQDCIDYQFLYFYDHSNYLIKIRPYNNGQYFKSCFIRWKTIYSGYNYFSPNDSIYTNIDSSIIKALYPEYKGKVIREEMSSISIEKDMKNSITEYDNCIHNIDLKSPTIWNRRSLRFSNEK